MSVHEDDAPDLAPDVLKRSWKIVTIAGAMGMFFGQGIRNAPFQRFLLEMNFQPYHFAMVTAIGSLALFFQLLSGYISSRISRRKPLWMALLICSRTIFAGVLLAPLVSLPDNLRIYWILFSLFLHGALDHCGQPLWFSWMADLLPKNTLSRHWASRHRFIMGMRIIVQFSIAAAMHYFDSRNMIVIGYGIVAGTAVVVGLIDICLFFWVPEPEHMRAPRMKLRQIFIEPLKDRHFRPFLVFLCSWKMAVAFGMPLIAVFLMERIGLSVTTVQILLGISTVSAVLVARFWGLLCDIYGHRTVIRITALGRGIYLTAIMLCPPNSPFSIPVAVVAFLFEGIAISGVMISFQTARMQLSPRRNRTAYVGTINVMSMGVAQGIGASLAGMLLKSWEGLSVHIGPWIYTDFHVSFSACLALGFCAWLIAERIPESNHLPLREIIRQLFVANPIIVARNIFKLNDSNKLEKRITAARRLGALKSPLAIHELIAGLDDPVRPMRQACANALGRISAGESVQHLAGILHNPESDLQKRAAHALGRIGDEEALKALLENLHSQESDALMETVEALGQIRSSAAILPLICLMGRTDDHTLRRQIATSLSRITEEKEAGIEVLRMIPGNTIEPV
ncbi:MAG: MFS transporter [Candidatus Sumerlaeia bacterium]